MQVKRQRGHLLGPSPLASQASFSNEEENTKGVLFAFPFLSKDFWALGVGEWGYSPSKYSFCFWSTPWIWNDIKNSGEAFVRKTSWCNRSTQIFWTQFQAIWIPGYSSASWRVGWTSHHCGNWRLLMYEVYQPSLCIVGAPNDFPGASLHFQAAY